MTWGRDARTKDLVMVPAPVEGSVEPLLLDPDRDAIGSEVGGRADAFTPEWTGRDASDAGVALVRTYGALAGAVHERLDRIPRRLLFEHVAIAGVHALPARPADATLAVEVSPRATGPIVLPAGSAFLATGGSTPVAIETVQSCHAIPGSVAAVAVFVEGWDLYDAPDELGGIAPFGAYPTNRSELWIGMDTPVSPPALVSFGVEMVPPPTRPWARSSALLAERAPVSLRWEAMTSAGAVELVVERDETQGLTASGVVQLRGDTPSPWTASTLPGRRDDPPLRWLRARPVTNSFPPSTRLARVVLNAVPARASRTVRDEVAEPIDRRDGARSRYRLSQVPVLPGSVVLEVRAAGTDAFGATSTSTWTEVPDLSLAKPDERVFALDTATGVLTFGDGITGRAVPRGFRNVVARSYATGGGTEGLPAPGDSVTARRSLPGLTGATVLGITTGADAESSDELAVRGPAEIRSRQRAVAAADYATRALGAPGVDVARAHCLPGRDPRSAGGEVPGVVGVLVVPAQTTTDAPPVPDEAALRAVAEHLATGVGVVGAEVVAAAPRYREIAVHAVLVAKAGADPAGVASSTRDRIDRWLDPLVGGSGTGWSFGGTVEWDVLTRLLLRDVADLVAVSSLSFRVGGRRLAPCEDVALDVDELVWPGSHVLDVQIDGASS